MTRVRTTTSILIAAAIALAAASCSADDPTSAGGAVSGDLTAISEAPPEEAAADEITPEDTAEPEDTEPEDTAPEEPEGDVTDTDDATDATDAEDPTDTEDEAPAASYEPPADPTPLRADPAVVIGTLDNGLTYYLRHNERPGESLDVRLLVNVGSVDETDEQAGIGHFIEHMLFNGTEDYPGNSLGEALREIGVELGPDLNAHVGHDETVYQVSVNTDEPHKVPLVFHALAQMAGAATFEADAVASEVGVVLDEMRLSRESVDGYINSEFDRVYTQGTPYEGRDPIGTTATIESFTPEMLRAFYETWHVASNMAVVAVGDRTVKDLEALVEEHFGSLPASEAPQRTDVEVTPYPEPSTHVVTDARHGYSYISLDIPIAPHDARTVGGERLDTMELLIEVMIQNRLTDAYHRDELSQVDPPQFGSFTYNRGLRYYGTNWQGDNLDTASTDYLSVLQTAQEHGFTAGELERAASQLAVYLQFQLDNTASTQDREYAGLYQQHFFYGADIGTVEERVARISALLDEVAAEELTEHYRWLMGRAGTVVIAVGPDAASVPTAADLDTALDAATPGPPPVEVAVVEQLMEVPAPADPVADGPMDILDGYEWEFANGARVMFAPSDIAEGVVHLQAQSLGGWSVLGPGDRAVSAVAVDAVQGSGLGDLSRSELGRFLEDRNVSLGAFIGETVEGFSGGAGTEHLETMFQLLHLLVTAPRVDDQAFDDALNTAARRTSLSETDPEWQAWAVYNEARYGETWHRPFATREELASLSAPRLLSLYESRLGSVDDLIVAVVGDTDVSVIERLARHYIGTLPAGAADTYANRRPPMTGDLVRRDVQLEEGESAVLEIYYEAEVPLTPLGSVAADVLETALSERLFLVIREELGASYAAAALVDSAAAPTHVFDSLVYVTLDPDRFDEIYSRVLAIIGDMAANGMTAEEYAQAAAIVATDYSKTSNGDLLGALLSRLHIDDEDMVTPRRRLQELEQLSPEDVRALAAAIYGEGGRIEIVSKP